MTIGDLLEALLKVISLPFKIFTIDFWQGLYDLEISVALFLIYIYLTFYSFHKANKLKKEQKKDGNIDNNKLKFWKKSFWFFESKFPKPIFFISSCIAFFFLISL